MLALFVVQSDWGLKDDRSHHVYGERSPGLMVVTRVEYPGFQSEHSGWERCEFAPGLTIVSRGECLGKQNVTPVWDVGTIKVGRVTHY